MWRLLFSLFFIILVVSLVMKSNFEGLCGNYSLTYSKVKDIFKDSEDVSEIYKSYNMYYNKDLLIDCI